MAAMPFDRPAFQLPWIKGDRPTTSHTNRMSDSVPQPPPATGIAKRLGINLPVFLGATLAILLVVIFGAVLPNTAARVFGDIQGWIVTSVGWLYMVSFGGILFFCIALAISPYGRIKLGPDDCVPDYNYISWFAMLFSAGMGIGLMFFSVAEPLSHFASPPEGEGGTAESARFALRAAFFHWGYHGWAIYALVGMVLAYFSFRHDLPLAPRSALYPALGQRIYGPIGHEVDIFAIIGTMFGVATSMGLGIMQLNAGANYLFDLPIGITQQLVMMAAITGITVCSAMAGLDAGMQRLSQLNILLAVSLLLFIVVTGPWQFMLSATVQNYGEYLSGIVEQTFVMYAYSPGEWFSDWTLFYWGWWIAWSPFVGMFIARVSRGRTIREFIIGVLLMPPAFTFLWMGFFGNAAFDLVMSGAAPELVEAVQTDISVALFRFLEHFPLTIFVSGLSTFLIITFFVTSADAGSLVMVTIASGGKRVPPVWQRVFWSILVGLVAAVLLLAGGLKGLQTMTISSALPFLIVILIMAWGLIQALGMENSRRLDKPRPTAYGLAPISIAALRHELSPMRAVVSAEEVRKFIEETVKPVFEIVARELTRIGMNVTVRAEDQEDVTLEVRYPSERRREFVYEVNLRRYEKAMFSLAGSPPGQEPGESDHHAAMVSLHERPQAYNIMGFSTDEVLHDVISQYERNMRIRLASDYPASKAPELSPSIAEQGAEDG